jgi:non-ribosomal peptide synthetase component F
VTITAGAPPEPAPLSVAQEALWYQSLLAPNRTTYNETISLRRDGPLDAPALRRAFGELVRRHPAWRTTFGVVAGEPVQIVHPPPSFDLPVRDLSHLTPGEAESEAARLMGTVSRRPYDVRSGPLLRPRLIRFPGRHHRLYLAMHHLIFDGVSVTRTVLPELVALYEAFRTGRPSPLPEPVADYADYARWEQAWIAEPRAQRRVRHWREHLTRSAAVALPYDHPRPAEPRRGGRAVALSLPAELVDRARAVGQRAGCTLFQVLASTWSLLLARYSGQDQVTFATAADLRQRPELEAVVGYCLTPLVMQIDLADDPTFIDLVLRVRNELLDGLDNLVPFERLVRELAGDGQDGNPIYQTMLVLEPRAAVSDPAWSIHQIDSTLSNAVLSFKLDLELQLDERPDGDLAGQLIYDHDLFEADTAARLVDHWLTLVAAAASDPEHAVFTLPMLTPAEEHRQLVQWNATETERPAGLVHELVHARWLRQPDAPAVSAAGRTLSYAELHDQARRVGRRLLAAGVVPGDVVAVCGEADTDLVAGVLGVLQTGGGYVLLPGDLDQDRLDVMIGDSGAVAALAPPGLAARLGVPAGRRIALGEREPDDAPEGPDEPEGPEGLEGPEGPSLPGAGDDPICTLHHSERTDAAVVIRHRSVANLATAIAADLGLTPADTVLVFGSSLFSLPAVDLWPPLIAGCRIVIAPPGAARDGAEVSRLISAERVTLLHARPSEWQALIDTGLKAARGLTALTGGEALSRELADEILGRCRILWHGYRAVETGGYCTLARVEPSGPIRIGRPIANARAYVVDRHLGPMPVGVTGELLVGGDPVGDGYRERAELTADRFGDDPFGPGRTHRTGVRARWLPDGDLQLMP